MSIGKKIKKGIGSDERDKKRYLASSIASDRDPKFVISMLHQDHDGLVVRFVAVLCFYETTTRERAEERSRFERGEEMFGSKERAETVNS